MSGLIADGSSVLVSCDKTTNENSEFSIVIRSTTDQEPTVVRREESHSKSAHETLTKAPKEKTAIQRYEDMEESALDQAALEGRSSSSSDNSVDKTPINKGQQPEDANAGVAVNKAPDDVSDIHCNDLSMFRGHIYIYMCNLL